MFQRLSSEASHLIDQLILLTYFMRGSIQYKEMLTSISPIEREKIADFLEKRIEQEAKKPNPIY